MFGTILILCGAALALSTGTGPDRSAAGLACHAAAASPWAVLTRGIERPLPSEAQVAALAERLGWDEAHRGALQAAVTAAAAGRRQATIDVLAGRSAGAVLAVIDARDGRPTDEALMPVADEIVEVGRALRRIDEEAHAAVQREVERLVQGMPAARSSSAGLGGPADVQPAARAQALRDADRFLRRVRVLDPLPDHSSDAAGGAVTPRRPRSDGIQGLGIDLLEGCRSGRPSSEEGAALRGLLRRFAEGTADGARIGSAASPPEPDPLVTAADFYASALDVALRLVETRESAIAEAAGRAVASGDRGAWDEAIDARRQARAAAAQVGELAADAIAEVIALERTPEAARIWRQALRRAVHPDLFPAEPVAELHRWITTQDADQATLAAIGAMWRDYLQQRERASAGLVRFRLAGADGMLVRREVSGRPATQESHGVDQMTRAMEARSRLDTRTAASLLDLLPPALRQRVPSDLAPSVAGTVASDGTRGRSDDDVGRAAGECKREIEEN